MTADFAAGSLFDITSADVLARLFAVRQSRRFVGEELRALAGSMRTLADTCAALAEGCEVCDTVPDDDGGAATPGGGS